MTDDSQLIRAVRIHQYGGPEELRLEAIPRPEPKAGEVLIRVRAAGVLPADWKVREGQFRAFFPVTFPFVAGSALAGVVEAVGPGVAEFAPGQAVFGRGGAGAYAELVAAGVATLAPKPAALGFAEAAAISAGATTAYAALFENAGLAAGQRVLIHGGAGGVGAFAVQLARWKGARVIATASAANRAFVSSLGAETVIDYAAEPFEEAAGGVDAVLDTIGGETLLRSMRTVRPGGVVVSLLGQPPQDLAAELGIRAMNNQVAQPFPSRELLQTIAALIESGQIAAHLGPAFALEEAAMAQELVRTGHGRGRVTLRIGPGEG